MTQVIRAEAPHLKKPWNAILNQSNVEDEIEKKNIKTDPKPKKITIKNEHQNWNKKIEDN
jgi:hypothetical protein